MAQLKLALVAVAALTLGVLGHKVALGEGTSSSAGKVLIAQNDAPPADTEESTEESAKMGKEEGTHTGPDQGATPENDTSKIEQPARRNPATGGDGEQDQE